MTEIIDLQNLLQLITLKDILNLLLFLALVFLGVSVRAMIEIERYGRLHLKDIRFFNRFFIALGLSYVLKLQLQNTETLKQYYAELIILFCIFVNDIVKFVFDNKAGILLYFLNAFTKGFMDLKRYLVKKSKEEPNDNSNTTDTE